MSETSRRNMAGESKSRGEESLSTSSSSSFSPSLLLLRSSCSSPSSSSSSAVRPPTRLPTEKCCRHLAIAEDRDFDDFSSSSTSTRRRRPRRSCQRGGGASRPPPRQGDADAVADVLDADAAEAMMTPSTTPPSLEALLRGCSSTTTTTTTARMTTRNSTTTTTTRCSASESAIPRRDSVTSSSSSSSSSSYTSSSSSRDCFSDLPTSSPPIFQRTNSNTCNNSNSSNRSSARYAMSRNKLFSSCSSSSSSWASSSSPMSVMVFLVAAALLVVTSLPVGASAWRQRNERRQCEHITIPMCRGIGYNLTYMPNQFNHETQEEAGLEVHQFWPLVEIQCSPHLRFFLCSMYAPICIPNYSKPLPACRNVCEQAKQGCAPIMRQYGFAWPERMNCDGLPEYGDPDNLCMGWEYNQTTDASTTPPSQPPKGQKPAAEPGKNPGKDNEPPASGPSVVVGVDGEKCSCSCKDPLVALTAEKHVEVFNRGISTGSVPNCAKPCHSMYFNQDERAFVSFWIGLWAILCGLSTLLTCLTFFIDMERFQYPERPIIFMSGCYLMVSIGYIVRLAVGHQEIACNGDIIRYQATGPAVCTVVFILIYFFGMAACIWWVCLSFTWFLAAGLKWGSEAIASYSQYFHLAAWFIPAVKTIAVLAMSSVDGDPVSGICFVGNQNLGNLRGFVLAPHCAYLLVGILFLLAGFISLFRIRSVIKQQGHSRADKLEKLMIRIGIFTVLYTVPASIVIACLFYEQYYREAWEHAVTCACDGEGEAAAAARAGVRPDYAVFMLKYFMCLVVGITSGFWIWSGKTLESWRRFNANLCSRRDDCSPHSPSPTHQRLYCKSITPPPSKNIPISHV